MSICVVLFPFNSRPETSAAQTRGKAWPGRQETRLQAVLWMSQETEEQTWALPIGSSEPWVPGEE